MPEKYLKETLKLIDKIIAEGNKSSGRKGDPLFEKFIKLFYLRTPAEFLSEQKPAYLYASASEIWKFIIERKSNEPRKVRVFNPDTTIHGWKSERTIVETCTTDSPFILDSLTAALTESGHRIYEVIHPILKMKRVGGKITELYEDEKDGCTLESVMHFEISHLSEKKDLKALEELIDNVLYFVNLTVADWRPMMAKAKEINASIDAAKLPFNKEYVAEVKDFLSWATSNNFIFMGYREYSFADEKGKPEIKTIEGSELGIFRARDNIAKPVGLAGLPRGSLYSIKDPTLLEITKSSRKSIVHRPVHMDYIGIKKFDAKGKVVGEHRLLGLFTSSVYYQSAKLIPIIRTKIDAVVKRSGFEPDSHNGKALLTVLEGYPREDLLQVSEDDLFNISMGIVSLNERPRTKLFVRKDRFSRFLSCIVFIPRDRFNTQLREKIQSVLESAYNGKVTDYYTQVTESPLARVQMLVKLDPADLKEPDLAKIEEQLIEISNSWVNGLRDVLTKKLGEQAGEKLYYQYVDAFPESFKDLYHFGATFCDIVKMEEAYRINNLALDLYQLEKDEDGEYQLKLYHPEKLVMLSKIMPILENMGFNAVDELTFFIEPPQHEKGIWIHHFRLKASRAVMAGSEKNGSWLARIKHEFEDALFRIWHNEIENDALNKLILRANLKWRDVILLRAYSKYILQTSYPYSHSFTASVVARHPVITRMLVELFHLRFMLEIKSRETKEKALLNDINTQLANVTNVAEDRVLRQFLDTIMATLRTNYFQKDIKGEDKKYISFKLDSKKVPNLPLPRPYAEIFVYSYDVEGIHLRGGKVARGGLRWSDRKEDFRTEVLGLVKAQMVKNSVIVPTGSKGGFVVKHQVEGDRDKILAQGQECYRNFLRGLLDLTDNIIDGKITPPKNTVRYDGDDPYLVVAADKGTATFSDIANAVAKSYNFWLDDAFASGGSVGYDHKKMAITARGAWISVKRHFMEAGIDIEKEDFTTVGIGDMAGDVFGNGMLLSDRIKLVGAFNHMHIFIDPNPDPKKSFEERKRLFVKPRSSWADYNQKLISEGGGIFERSAKTITISKQAREVFGITETSLAPDALIRKMLTANVGLLWNGGIGTYVKAESESNSNVGDKANDNLRVNGGELKCKVVGEGGNLGFTQLGRIEYALKGGRINTDAIDNSAGVDCSDHEVNIKIALRRAMEKKKLTLAARDKFLAEMTDEVAELVLKDNKFQTLALTIAEMQGPMVLEQKSRLMRALEEKGMLNRKIEFLPADEAIATRQGMKKGLTRPELSVLLAYSKIAIYEELITTNMPDDEYFNGDLVNYFPVAMRKKYKSEIESHQLRREIIATSIANSIVNRAGSTFFQRMKENTGMKGCDVARAYAVTRDSFGLREIWSEIEKSSNIMPANVQTELYLEVRSFVERATSWFLRNQPTPLKVAEAVNNFAPTIKKLSEILDQIITPAMKAARDKKLEKYISLGAPKALARRISDLDALASACDIVHVAKGSTLPIKIVGQVYYELGTRFELAWLRAAAKKLISHSHWSNLAVQTMTETLYDQQMKLAARVIKTECKDKSCGGAIETWSAENEKEIQRYDSFVADLKKQEVLDNSMLTVAIQRIAVLLN